MLVAKVITFLVFIMPMLLLMTVHSMYFLAGIKGLGRGSKLDNDLVGEGISIVVPIRNEPEEILEELIKYVARLGCCRNYELIIVSDDPPERAARLKEMCEGMARELGLTLKFIARDRGGNRATALNTGVAASSYNYVLILDVDSRPDKWYIPHLLKCVSEGYDACVGRWEGYYDRATRIAKAVSNAMKFTVDVLYRGRSSLNLFIFPLGSGTLFRKSSLLSVGLWDGDVIQDDMHIGTKFLSNNLKVGYVDEAVVKVLVPSLYTSLRIQQGRWAYGAAEILRRSFKSLIKAKTSLVIKLEAMFFLAQYIPAALAFLGSIAIPLLALILKDDVVNYGLIPIAASIIVVLLYSLSLYSSLRSYNIGRWVAVRSMGSSSAVTATLLPTIFINTAKAFLSRGSDYKITPKGRFELFLRASYMPEALYLTYLVVVILLNMIFGNILTALWCMGFALAIIYVLLRAGRASV